MCTNPTPNSSTESAPVQPSVLPVQKSNDREQPIFISAIPFRLGSPFKIECLYKSSPIRERVLNARTSPLPRRKPSIHLSTLFPYNPFPGPFLLPFLLLISPPSPFILPPPPFLTGLYLHAGSTTPSMPSAGLPSVSCILRREIR